MEYWINKKSASEAQWASFLKGRRVIAGTGPRAWSPTTKTRMDLVALLDKLGTEGREIILMSGMAEGFDEFLAETALDVGIPFVAAVPHPTYGEYYWGRKSISKRNRLDDFNKYLEAAEAFVFVCSNLYESGLHANFVRNQFMVNWANDIIAWYKPDGGTADCLRRAQMGHVDVMYLNEAERTFL